MSDPIRGYRYEVNKSESSTSEENDYNNESTSENKPPPLLSKRRIVDLEQYFTSLQHIYTLHDNEKCNFTNLRLVNTQQLGIDTKVQIKCDICNFEKWVRLNEEIADTMNVNQLVVAGSVMSGMGFNNVQELLANLDIPLMSDKTFVDIKQKLVQEFEYAAMKEMEEAAELEIQYAKAEGNVIDGIPFITVTLDGNWLKRSYRTGKYDSLSGTACIIGIKTGKVLYVGVHNKFCSLCAWYEKRKREPRQHACYKTWGRDESSSSMEQHIIVSAFKCSIEMHGLIYKTIIADGDSSVYQEILNSNPYPVRVNKIECSNHLYRNFSNKIVDASKTKFLNVPKGSVRSFRERIKRSGYKFRKEITKCVRKLNDDKSKNATEKATELKKNMLSLIDHVYGDHSQCQERGICCEESNSNKNLVPMMKKSTVYDQIKTAVDNLSNFIDSLLVDLTSNRVECFNNIIAKTIGGKRINHGCRDSYYIRVLAAAILNNSKAGSTKLQEHNDLMAGNEIKKLEAARAKKNN